MAIDQPPPAVETVVVQTARLPPSIGDAAFSVIRLNAEDLQSTPRLDDALEQVAGLSLFRRTSSLGANPTTQGVSLREIAGSGASRALVTLDGVPQNDPFGGWVIWTGLPSETIQSASVVRGAGAGPYGAGALTGVIALEQPGARPGAVTADVGGGDLGWRRGEASADMGLGKADLLVSGGSEHSDGWVPVRAPQRGGADDKLTLNDWNFSARLQADIGPAVMAARVSTFDETRQAGLVGAASEAKGTNASLTFTSQPTATSLGWRLQGWYQSSNLANSSVSVAAGHVSATPSNNEYDTPATGYGFNGAVRRAGEHLSLEAGVDVRGTKGEDHENFTFTNGQFVNNRDAGGQTLVAGAYVEAAWNQSPWLVTAGVRVDHWGNSDSHLIQKTIATGVVTLNQQTPDASGVVPTGRLGIRRDLGGGFYLRAAGYAGFRPATLNELERPFRVGNDTTLANPGLSPEKLYGIEGGIGGDRGPLSWTATVFYNQLANAITNVTIGRGPGTFPVAGVVPAGGTVFQRQNAGTINARGVEADGRFQATRTVSLRTSLAYTYDRVDGGTAAPQLTGLRPAQTPLWTVTAGADWKPVEKLTVSAELRYESTRYDDDQNTRRLPPGTGVDLRGEYRLAEGFSAYVAADNVLDAAIVTGKTADGTFSYAPPRTVMVGLSYKR